MVDLAVPLPVAPELQMTVQGLVRFIAQHGLHRYRLDPQRSGCLYWVKEVVKVLSVAGHVPKNAPSMVEDVVKAARKPDSKYWCPKDSGRFRWSVREVATTSQ